EEDERGIRERARAHRYVTGEGAPRKRFEHSSRDHQVQRRQWQELSQREPLRQEWRTLRRTLPLRGWPCGVGAAEADYLGRFCQQLVVVLQNSGGRQVGRASRLEA